MESEGSQKVDLIETAIDEEDEGEEEDEPARGAAQREGLQLLVVFLPVRWLCPSCRWRRSAGRFATFSSFFARQMALSILPVAPAQ
jgi:hypothetical protein